MDMFVKRNKTPGECFTFPFLIQLQKHIRTLTALFVLVDLTNLLGSKPAARSSTVVPYTHRSKSRAQWGALLAVVLQS